MRSIELRPAAAADIEQAALWYESRRRGLGSEFLSSVHEALDRAAEHPEQFPVIHRGARRALLSRFPYSLYFRATEHRVLVVACVHGRRRETHWKSRL